MAQEQLDASRRSFLKSAAAAGAVAALPLGSAFAQAPKYLRRSISDPETLKRVIPSYKKAIRAMLALPPSDPRNWYRNALLHTLDCPHANWWFLPWHRAYIGWFERTCRALSGDADFALPYWDWTAEPRMPDIMFDDVLSPNAPEFIASYADFKNAFRNVVATADWWNVVKDKNGNLEPMSRYYQLLTRGVRFPDDLWFDIAENPMGRFFFDQPGARGLTRQKPDLDERTRRCVSLPMILDALSPRDFIAFGSAKGLSHHLMSGEGILENQPHDKVHNNIGAPGGFMQNFLSPIDPVFFLHHGNIDRLWDVWTRKQLARKYPILPEGYQLPDGEPRARSDYGQWAQEPFLFFADENGKDVKQAVAGEYAAISPLFDYAYTKGSGEEAVLPAAPPPPLPQAPVLTAAISASRITGVTAAHATARLTPALQEQGPLFAQVTLNLPPHGHGSYKVVVNGPEDARGVGPSSPFYAASLSMFGRHVMHGPITFTVPISRVVAYLRANKLIGDDSQIRIRVLEEIDEAHGAMIMAVPGVVAPAPRAAQLQSVVIEAR